MKPIRVLLADPQTLFREGLKALFAGCAAVEVVGDFARAEDVPERLHSTCADMVLMEIGRPAALVIHAARPETQVVFLTDRRDESALLEYRESGAAGYILKDTRCFELVGAMQTIHGGANWVSAAVAHRLLPEARQKGLTARENQVLKMTAEGRSVKEVAGILALSAKTVDAHKVNLMRKLRIHNKAQLVQYAYRNHILTLEYQA